MTKREFLTASFATGLGLMKGGAAFAQQSAAAKPPAATPQRGSNRTIPVRKVKTTKLFKSPKGFPNGIAVTPEGLWIAEQKLSGEQAKAYHMEQPKDLTEAAWLVDWNGKLLKTVKTPSRNTSGMAVGGGYVWMCANAAPEGIYQVDMNSRLISHRQIPLGPEDNGGGCHGGMWHDGKLWIVALRLRGILRVDPVSWKPEFLLPFYEEPGRLRYHGIAWDDGTIWQITGNDSHNYAEGRPGLVRYDAATGRVLEKAEFVPGSSDPHGLAMHDGKLISCDAGIHPGWPNYDSPTSGWIFRIDFV